MSRVEQIPILEFTNQDSREICTVEEFSTVYNLTQCVLFKSNGRKVCHSIGQKRRRTHLTLDQNRGNKVESPYLLESFLDLVRGTYESASAQDKQSWTLESAADTSRMRSNTRSDFHETSANHKRGVHPLDFMGGSKWKEGVTTISSTLGYASYCSFVLQDNAEMAVSRFTSRLKKWFQEWGSVGNQHDDRPMGLPDFFVWGSEEISHALRKKATGKPEPSIAETGKRSQRSPVIRVDPHYWIFLGQNPTSMALNGRTEHTDNVAHDGTVHYQIAGSKIWKLRPTQTLRDQCDAIDVALLDSYEVCVEEGDFWCINTRLWWHQTLVPPNQPWSISIARDIHLTETQTESVKNGLDARSENSSQSMESMSNVDIAWASGFIPKETILEVDEMDEEELRPPEDIDTDDYIDPTTKIVTSSYYYDRFLPPTIQHTSVRSKANCCIVLIGPQSPKKLDLADDYHEGKRTKIALRTTRDINEGDEFLVLVKKKNV